MINWEDFENAYKYYKSELVLEIINLFENGEDGKNDGYSQRLVSLKNAIVQNDFVKINEIAHSLKSVILNFYDPVSAQIASRIELMGKEKTENGLGEQFAQLELAANKLMAELNEYRKKIST
jgi:hypothetical protein